MRLAQPLVLMALCPTMALTLCYTVVVQVQALVAFFKTPGFGMVPFGLSKVQQPFHSDVIRLKPHTCKVPEQLCSVVVPSVTCYSKLGYGLKALVTGLRLA